jgi:ATP-dependent Clp protease ATP-binding subunit ClpC
MLLQIMEEGHLADARGRRVDFRNAIVVMTSNIGAELIRQTSSLGFNIQRDVEVEEKYAFDEMRKKLMEALRKAFRPEFVNRVDAIIVFHALTREQIAQIVDLELAKVSERLADHQILLHASEGARALLAQLGFDPEMGARPLRRVIQNKVEDRLSDGLLSGEFRTGDRVMVDATEGEIVLRPERPEPADTAEPALPAA